MSTLRLIAAGYTVSIGCACQSVNCDAHQVGPRTSHELIQARAPALRACRSADATPSLLTPTVW